MRAEMPDSGMVYLTEAIYSTLLKKKLPQMSNLYDSDDDDDEIAASIGLTFLFLIGWCVLFVRLNRKYHWMGLLGAVSLLPNPFYVPSLKKLTGNNKKVKDYIFKSRLAGEFVDSVHSLLTSMVQGYIDEGKYHLNIAFGCTGGHHRSVAIANAVAEEFKKDGMRVRIYHRDLDLQNKKR